MSQIEVLSLLNETTKGMTSNQISKALKISKNAVQVNLRALLRDKQIIRTGYKPKEFKYYAVSGVDFERNI